MIKKFTNLSEPVKASIVFFICSVLQKGISFFTTPIFTRLMTTGEYGEFNVFISWADVLGIFITFTLNSSVYQKKLIELDYDKDKEILTSSFQGLSVLTMSICFVLYILARKQVNQFLDMNTNLVIALFLYVFTNTIIGIWTIRQRTFYKYKAVAIFTIILVILKPVIGIWAVYSFANYKAEARIYSVICIQGLFAFPMLVYHFHIGKQFFDKSFWKYAVIYVAPLIPHYLSQRVLSQSDRLMINDMIGASEAGIYSLAHQVAWAILIINDSIESSLAPWIYSQIKEKNYKKIGKISIYPLILFGISCVMLIALTPEVISIFGSSEYRNAIWILPGLVLSTFFIHVYSYFIYFEYYYEKTKYILFATLISAILNFVLNYIFIKYTVYYSAAYTTMVCYGIYALLHYYMYKKICRDEGIIERIYNGKAILLISIGIIIVTLLFIMLYQTMIIRYIVIAIMGGGLFLLKDKMFHFVKTIRKWDKKVHT